MRRYGSNALVMASLLALTGCGIIPSFPDLWPFNDEPTPPQARLSQLEPVAAAATDATEAAVAAAPSVAAPAPSPSQPEPPAETAQLLPVPAPAPAGSGGVTASTPGAAAYIISPLDGAVVTNPVRVLFGLDRMGISPATFQGEGVGHHHLLINTDLPPLDLPIPVDQNHRHFSGGQSETSLNLPVGQHTLQLLLGDHTHTPHQPPVISRKITITVQ